MLKLSSLSVCALLLSSPCLASAIMVSGDGRNCYLATLQNSTPDNNSKGLFACDQAVASGVGDDHNLVAAFVNRADIRLRMGNYQAAAVDSEKAIALDSTQPVAHLNRGAAMVGLERYEDAIVALDLAIALDVEALPVAYFNRALAREALGDLPGAYNDYKQAVDLDPKFEIATQQLARFKIKDR